MLNQHGYSAGTYPQGSRSLCSLTAPQSNPGGKTIPGLLLRRLIDVSLSDLRNRRPSWPEAGREAPPPQRRQNDGKRPVRSDFA